MRRRTRPERGGVITKRPDSLVSTCCSTRPPLSTSATRASAIGSRDVASAMLPVSRCACALAGTASSSAHASAAAYACTRLHEDRRMCWIPCTAITGTLLVERNSARVPVHPDDPLERRQIRQHRENDDDALEHDTIRALAEKEGGTADQHDALRAGHEADTAIDAERFGARTRVADHERAGHRQHDQVDHADVAELEPVVVVQR